MANFALSDIDLGPKSVHINPNSAAKIHIGE